MASLADGAFRPLSLIHPLHRLKRLDRQQWRSSGISAPILRRSSAVTCCSRPSGGGAASYLRHSENIGHDRGGLEAAGLLETLRAGITVAQSFLPGGSWWSLERIVGDAVKKDAGGGKDVSVPFALQRMWQLVAADRWIIYGGFGSLLIAALSDLCIPHFLTASIFSAQSGDAILFRRNIKTLLLLCVSSGIFSGLRGCFFGIGNMILVKKMREMVYSALILQDMSFFDKKTVGNLTSRLGADCQQVSQVIGNDLNMISRNLLQGSGTLAYLFVLSWKIALTTLGICFILAVAMTFHGRYQKKAAKSVQDITANANDVAQDAFSLIKTVRVFGTEKQEYQKYLKCLKTQADIGLRQTIAYGLWNSSVSIFYHFSQAIAVIIGGAAIMSGHFSAEQLTKFILYSEWSIFATWRLADNWSSMTQAVGASQEVFKLMDLRPTKEFIVRGEKLQNLTGCVEFDNVSFSYPSRKNVPVLENINLAIHPNEVVAIVGLSGSGKSTIVNLILNLYEPTSGQLLIDGFPVNNLDKKWLRERIGYVGQEPRLFRTDVSSNIRYGCPRKISHEDVELAAKQAFAHEFISSLPNGYDTLVGDGLLSGGQKQRIAIARAVLRDPDILILDEATSALDAETEHYVKELLHEFRGSLKKKRTVIVIAHRLSTIQTADRIIVMDAGKIVEEGSHRQLLSNDGIYARLTKRQLDTIE